MEDKEIMKIKKKVGENHTLICEKTDKFHGLIQELRQEIRDLKQEMAMLKVDLLKSGHELEFR